MSHSGRKHLKHTAVSLLLETDLMLCDFKRSSFHRTPLYGQDLYVYMLNLCPCDFLWKPLYCVIVVCAFGRINGDIAIFLNATRIVYQKWVKGCVYFEGGSETSVMMS